MYEYVHTLIIGRYLLVGGRVVHAVAITTHVHCCGGIYDTIYIISIFMKCVKWELRVIPKTDLALWFPANTSLPTVT